MSQERWSEHTCEWCDGTGKSFFCDYCDTEKPSECLHEADPDFVEEVEEEE